MEFLTTVLGSAFVGALVATAANWFKEIRLDRRRRERDFVELQLRDLYGPLHYFVAEIEQIFKHTTRISSAAEEELDPKKWGQQESALDRLYREQDRTLDINNRYFDRVIQNGKKMTEVLQRNWSMVDLDDVELFSQFQLHYMRLETERLVDPEKRMPRVVHMRLGEIELPPADFTVRIKLQFASKRTQLHSL